MNNKKTAILLIAILLISSIVLQASAAELAIVDCASVLNIRSGASTSGAVVEKLSSGSPVVVLNSASDWYTLNYGSTTAYGFGEYLKITSAHTFATPVTGYITGSVVNLRSEANASCSVVAKLRKGTKVTVTAYSSEWFTVQTANSTGYIYAEYLTFYSGSGSSSSAPSAASTGVSPESIITEAKKYIGTPYVYGGTTANGFDCSGFTCHVYGKFGISLNRRSRDQVSNGTKITNKNDLQMGDLVFFRSGSSSTISHVAIYISDGNIIHARSPGKLLGIDSMNSDYYSKYFVCGARVL